MRQFLFLLIGLLTVGMPTRALQAVDPPGRPSGNAIIRATAGSSEIVITTTERLAGAIHSLTWNGREFINSTDHGRQLQSASNFDAGGPFVPETFNPTEAGSVSDGAGPRSSSRLLHLIARENQLQTTTQMAFWLRPDGKSLGHPARNTSVLSNHLLTKRVQIGYGPHPQAIQYDVTFSIPLGESHRYAQLEALTGYMPPEFSEFWAFDPQSRMLKPLSDGPGEQPHPVVLATPDRAYAMGIVARDPTPAGITGPGYGRFRFRPEKVVKWNCVYRWNSDPVEPRDYSFRMLVLVGTLADVEAMLRTLAPAS